MAKDILQTEDGDDLIIQGDFALGESLMQECGDIIRLNTGELKYDALLGPNLIRMVKAPINRVRIEHTMRINFARDGKDFSEIKQFIKINTGNG